MAEKLKDQAEAKQPMAPIIWGTTLKPEEVFQKSTAVAQHKKGLKILIYGKEDTMKSGFALSFPPPIYSYDTEIGQPPLFQYFVHCPVCKIDTPHVQMPDGKFGPCSICKDPNGVPKEINWCDATFLNPDGLQDASVALQKFEASMTLLKDIKSGTIVIDTGTDIWDWIQEWLNEVGKKKEGHLLQFEWAKAKLKWRKLLLQLLAKPVHVVMTAQPQEIYANKEPTGVYRARIQGESAHAFDIVIHAMRWEVVNPATQAKTVQYKAEITKCRFKKGWRPIFDEITYDKLTAALKKDLGVEVW